MQLVPWTQEKEDQEPDAPCVRLDIAAVNKVVFEDLKLSWDELDFIGIKKVTYCALSSSAAAHMTFGQQTRWRLDPSSASGPNAILSKQGPRLQTDINTITWI